MVRQPDQRGGLGIVVLAGGVAWVTATSAERVGSGAIARRRSVVS